MPRGSARRDALLDLRECMQMAILFQAIHDSDSDLDSQEDMELDEAGGEMDVDNGPQIQECVRPDATNQANPLFGAPNTIFQPNEWVPFETFEVNDPTSLQSLQPGPMDRWEPIQFDRLNFHEPHVVMNETLGGFQQLEQDSDEGYGLEYFSSSDSESDAEDVMNLIAFMHAAVSECRYIVDRARIPKSMEFRFTYFQSLPDDDFRVITRLSREIFGFVVRLIEDDPIFSNRSPFPQAPVHWQVACALDRLGNDGQGVSFARSKLIWGLGHGTVQLYYRGVVYALCNGRNTFIAWPDVEERARISSEMEVFGFKGAVGFVDGTTFPLHEKPSMHGNSYYDRKKRYSVHGQIVCDNKYMICHLQTGMPGSCHDSGVFSHSPMVCHPKRFFSQGEYLISDSAYAASTFVVPAYRIGAVDEVGDVLELERIERFNTFLSKARVVNEHTIGIFKARWASLCSMRTVLCSPGDIIKIIRHVVACVILHNIAMERDPWEEDNAEEIEPELNGPAPPEALPQRQCKNTAGQRKRLEVLAACLAYHDRNR